MREGIEEQLHDFDGINDPGLFQLRQAAALGRHHTQRIYEGIEKEVAMALELYIQAKEEENEAV